MEQQPPKRSLLILLAVAIAVVGLVVVKSLPKEPAAPARPTPAGHPVVASAPPVSEDSTRDGSGEHARTEEAREADRDASASSETLVEDAPAATVQDSPSEPEPKQQPPTGPVPAQPPAEPEPAAPEPAQPDPEQPVAPFPGSKLKEALASGRPTMVDFGAGWCQPCKMMEPVLKEAARKYQGKANIVYVDTDKLPQIARDYKIRAIPTQIFFDAKGEKVSEHIGYWPIDDVARALAAAGVSE
jgi:thioredoxin 1